MSTDATILLVGMAIFGAMFWVVVISKLGGTIANPFRSINPRRSLQKLSSIKDDGPVLSVLNAPDTTLVAGQKVEIDDHVFSILTDSADKATIIVTLKQLASIHVVALGGKSNQYNKLEQLKIGNVLQKVNLEGDFSDHISMYCSKGREVDLLHIFDPPQMAYFLDFCRAYDFEIYRDTLTISQSSGSKDRGDQTSMVEDTKNFVKRNSDLLARI